MSEVSTAIFATAKHDELDVELTEFASTLVDRGKFIRAAGVELGTAQEALGSLVDVAGADDPAQLRLSSRRWIGTQALGNVRVYVRPRLSPQRLATMIRFAMAEDYATGAAPNVRADVGLDELIGRIFTSELAAIRQAGIARRYVERHDRLDVIRGRVDFTRSLPWNDRGMTSVACRFHELSADNLDNRLVLAALERVFRLDLTRDTRASLLEHRLAWQAMAQHVAVTPAHFERARLAYTRLTKHYGLAHVLAALILNGSTADAPQLGGAITTSGLVLDMAELFELCVARVLEILSAGRGWTVRKQRTDASAIVNGAGRLYRRVRPDVEILDSESPVLIADAKYKDYWRDDRRIGNDDLYQMFFYAERARARYGMAGAPRAAIIAPLPDADERKNISVVRAENRSVRLRASDGGDLRLDLLLLPIGELLDRLAANAAPESAVRAAADEWQPFFAPH